MTSQIKYDDLPPAASAAAGGGEATSKRKPIFIDIRRYFCEYCGISRSKKSLLTTHLLSHHKEQMENRNKGLEEERNGETKSNMCEECGATFRKPAYLKQHMRSHSVEDRSKNVKELTVYDNEQILVVFIEMKTFIGVWREALDPMQRTPKCEEVEFYFLNGLVTGWGTSCEAPSSQPLSRTVQAQPFACPVDDCNSSYRRKDHLTRHILQHQGKLFSCPVESCKHSFAYQGNMRRHVLELHEDSETAPCEPSDGDSEKQHVCPEVGCGKMFKYASRLRKHEDSHVKLDSVEAICCEPGCMKSFSNAECLKAHLQSCHRYINCEVCGTQQLKKNIKRHMRTHEGGCTLKKIQCSFKGCLYTFTSKSNLNQHIKAVHLAQRPFACRFSGCGKRFPFRHVRDNHENSGCHVYVQGDFGEADEQFRLRPRGGLKRKYPNVEMLMRKRVILPGQVNYATSHPSDYLAWLLSTSDDD